MGFFRVLIYGIILSVYAGSLVYDIRYLPRIGFRWWVAKLVMLSVINLVLQTVYSAICFICSLFDWNEERHHAKKAKSHTLPSYWRQTKLHRICDFMYFTSVFPIGMATCFLFWALYIANPSLVVPPHAINIIPQWLNHVLHTAPSGFVLVDTLLTCHHAPSRIIGTGVVLVLFALYCSILFGVHALQGFWLYPLFDHLKNQQIATFLSLAFVLLWFLYLIGDGLNSMLWGKAPHSVVSPPKAEKFVEKED